MTSYIAKIGKEVERDPFDKDMYDLEQIQRRIEDGFYEDDWDDDIVVDSMDLEDMSGASEGDR